MQIEDGDFTGEPDLLDAIRALGYPSPAHAVLHRSVFPPPSIVMEVGTHAVVNAVRRGSFDGLGRVDRFEFIAPPHAERLFGITTTDASSRGVYVDDNSSPHFAFLACFKVGRHISSTQLCHVFPREFSQDPRFFTSLPNLVLVPAWLAKLTDADDAVMRVLRWAVRLVYGFCPGDDGRSDHECALCERPANAPAEDSVQG